MSGQVVVSIHDVAPSTFEQSRALVDLVERHGVISSLLVVPGPWQGFEITDDDQFVRWLRGRQADGHEVCLHGWSHTEASPSPATTRTKVARLLARGCAEFADLSEDEARNRLELGRSALRSLGFQPAGFTPPGWLASPGALRALRSLGFTYTTSQLSVLDIETAQSYRMPAVCQRPGSPLTTLGSRLVRRLLVSRVAEGRDVRLALHPSDLNTEALRHETTTLVQVASFGRTTTYGRLVNSRRFESSSANNQGAAA